MSATESKGDVQPSFQTLARQMEKLPPCQAQCPNSGDIRAWLGVIAQHKKNKLTLDEASPCAPANSGGCGLIGALPVGCGATAVEPATWGGIKASFR